MTLTLERPDIIVEDEEQTPSDTNEFAHYVKKDQIVDSAVFGTAMEALCGFLIVSKRDPQKFPVCPECKEIYEEMSE